ncbi:glycosyltransferase [Mucilaginibacter aquaedulcis]|uniref:glycosyltransferase n=1 Tax=Mucilaginibacter aquaedulcis TaxID=1187081 RepID=UPI0025B37615|nr:glycosyltransferase [Mucilaginibacter aquaedulcis]MDN3549558.1 glycosyltransferase [Mucilaginibacter aquaedulcis]
MVFISMSDEANGAENVLLMAATAARAPLLFLKKAKTGGLHIPEGQVSEYVTDKSMLRGFFGLPRLLKPYRRGFVIMSTHPYLNACMGFLKRIGYLRSELIVRECTSVFTRFTGLKKWSYKLAYRLGYPGVNLVVCQTELMRNQFMQHVTFVPGQKIVVQANPVDLEQILLKAESSLKDVDTDAGFICAAGRLIPEKGFSLLIHAFEGIYRQYPGLKLLILGEGPERMALTNLIKSLNLSQQVILKGRIDNPIPYFKKARLCVVSSIKEGFPNVLLEMMTANPTVISTLCAGGIEDIPGILKIDTNSVNELEFAIKRALDNGSVNKSEIVQEYLHNRTPKVFISSLIQNFENIPI